MCDATDDDSSNAAGNISHFLLSANWRTGGIHFLHPLISLIRTKLPRRKIIFDIAEHGVPFLWGVTVFHDKTAAQFEDDVQRADADRAFFHAGIAGSAGAQLFHGNIIVQKRFAIVGKLPVFVPITSYFFQPVARVHHYFAGR